MSNAPGGIIGAAAKAARLTKGLLSKTESIALLLVLFAGIITIIRKNYTEDLWSYAMWFGIALGIAALFYEMSGAKGIARAVYNARPGALLSSLAIWLIAFGFSVNQWLGAASENQAEKSNVHKAAFVQTVSAKETRESAKMDLDRLQNRMGWMETAVNGKPVRAVEAAEADIQNAMAHKFWKSTDACTVTKGPQTRAFCDKVAAAKAENALAIEKATLSEDLKAAQARYAEASAAVANGPAEFSEARNDLLLLTKYAGLEEQDAQTLNGLLAILTVSILLSFGSMRKAWEEEEAKGPRRHWNIWLSLKRLFSKAFWGAEPSGVQVVENTYTDRRTAQAILDALSGPKMRTV